MFIYIYFNWMLIMYLFILSFSLMMYILDMSIMLEWMFYSFNSFNIEFLVLLDWISLLFISFIFLISSMILLYSSVYMEEEKYLSRFIFIVMLFVFSMVLMILSPNVISILFGWDGLGLTSYCLVIYYQHFTAYNSGMVTVLCNRVGDVGLLMSVSLLMMGGTWNIWGVSSSMTSVSLFMLLLAAITKSAQIPFSVWLPMAMAAPTPVSALVHSSTLVTAGVYLMIRFNYFLVSNVLMGGLLFFLAVLTMFMAGVMANVENDLKKIIALSTLSQLGLMMMILSVGFKFIAFYHLLTHAIFKSMLFMCAGIIIHLAGNSQDIRVLGGLKRAVPFTMMSFFIANLALCGTPFLAGFYSKDYIMELIYSSEVNVVLLVLIVLSLMLTVSYSVRLFYYLFFKNMKFYSYNNFKESGVMNLSMMILMVYSIIIGAVLNWVFFFDFFEIQLNLMVKLLTLFMCLMGVIVAINLMILNLSKFYKLNYFMGFMWFLNYLYLWVYNPINILGVNMFSVDKTWVEFTKKDLGYLIKYFEDMAMYKIFVFIMIFIYSSVLIYLTF
uniref:NADH-ubiquinone oxidoreductase chain 5 n=1 Tax=Vollenhovia emeryi TaxID=411798 RepID=A0A160DS95_VOLEM|nr:NADH dehydrogenase subunit 5 [Vollenhovia emeryi]ANA91972.1 NADH dehydrogenase subunit 5 [Vollenhovia emeryi]